MSQICEIALNDVVIQMIKQDCIVPIQELMKDDLKRIVLYGSCARGNYTADSDVDIAILTRCNRWESKKYDEGLADLATELAMKYFAVVNFVCLPYDEYLNKKEWYAYFRNIEKEGEVLYG